MTGFANTGQSASARVLLKAEIQQPTPNRTPRTFAAGFCQDSSHPTDHVSGCVRQQRLL